MQKVTVLGTGAWGCTMAQVLCDAGNEVLIWGRSKDVVNEINSSHTNTKYLDKNVLPAQVRSTTDIAEAFAFSHYVILAIPAQTLREKLIEWKDFIGAQTTIVSTLKGIEMSTLLRMTEVIEEITGSKRIALITGPNLANELILRQPAGAVVAAHSQSLAEEVRALFRNPYYRVYTSVDVLGCELAGAIKSVIALAVGISIGMEYGENTQAMLITRGLNEVARLCAAGLAGMGDLVASCGSALSRNRTFGEVLGRSGSMEYTREHVAKTVEGVASSNAILEIAHRVGVEVPVIEAVADIVSGTITPVAALERLMSITTASENFIK